MFRGSWSYSVTPFRNGRIDEPRLKALVDFHVENGNRWFPIPAAGTTG